MMSQMTEDAPTTRVPVTVFYKPELDALRFFAFLGVFMTHTIGSYGLEKFTKYGIPVWIARIISAIGQGGAYGVDLFFVLSAYLITELLLREKEKMGRLDLSAFYLRRVLRIWPLYYVFVIATYAVPFLNPGHEFSVRYLVAFLFLSGNWALVRFGWNAGPAVSPLWSVSVEEQFYLLWPPIVATLRQGQLVVVSVGMILLANAVRIWQATRHVSPQHLWGNTFAHLDSIASGVLLSVFVRGRYLKLKTIHRIGLMCLGLASFAVVSYFVGPDQLGPIRTLAVLPGYVAVVVGCLVILIAFQGLPIDPKGWLVRLGKISYGLYAYHVTCLFIVRRVGLLNHLVLAECAGFLLTVGIAAASYSFLEKPFLVLKQRFTYIESRPA